jgi:hypothetical protein
MKSGYRKLGPDEVLVDGDESRLVNKSDRWGVIGHHAVGRGVNSYSEIKFRRKQAPSSLTDSEGRVCTVNVIEEPTYRLLNVGEKLGATDYVLDSIATHEWYSDPTSAGLTLLEGWRPRRRKIVRWEDD